MEETIATTTARPFLGEDWFDPLETAVRGRIRGFIEELLEAELAAVLQRGRYDRRGAARGHRHGHRERQLIGTFGPITVSVPRARLVEANAKTLEWRNQTLPAYQRLTRRAEALIASTYLAGTNTRRVRRALGALFGGAIGKDVVSRAWHKVRSDWEAWQKRDLAGDDIVRLILDGTVVRVRLDRKATSPASRCWWRWAFAATARRCCSPCATWVAKARQPGALSWMTWWPGAWQRPNC